MSASPEEFDSDWYLSAYPDVAQAGICAFEHFVSNGLSEGRFPRSLDARALEVRLWEGLQHRAIAELTRLCASSKYLAERTYAAWALARWHGAHCEWHAVHSVLRKHIAEVGFVPGHTGPTILFIESLTRTHRFQEALNFASDNMKQLPNPNSLQLARANIWGTLASVKTPTNSAFQVKQLDSINQIYASSGLEILHSIDATAPLTLDNLEAVDLPSVTVPRGPLVSVVVPMHNSAHTICTAALGLIQQTWNELEIVFVDDGSTDNTVSVLCDFLNSITLKSGQRIEVVSLLAKSGTYKARNAGVRRSTGTYITVHDADDWSHPRKIELQCSSLLQTPGAVGSITHWTRCTTALRFGHWFLEDGWIHRNISSLMVRRKVLDGIGYWDEVCVGADSEYLERILQFYGPLSIVDTKPGVPLSLGRDHARSLTNSVETHASTMFSGARKQYWDSFRRWHSDGTSRSDLFISCEMPVRRFLAPTSLTGSDRAAVFNHPYDVVQQSSMWIASWYANRYEDLLLYQGDLLEHYMKHGDAEGRDPSAGFSSSGYRLRYLKGVARSTNALHHYLTVGRAAGNSPLPTFTGAYAEKAFKGTVMLSGHQSLEQAYGAERCLIDIAESLSMSGWRVIVTLPAVASTNYLESLLRASAAVKVFPYVTWGCSSPESLETIQNFAQVIAEYNVGVVHVNTLALDSPVVAARAAGCSVVVHAHEAPDSDTGLVRSMKTTPQVLATRSTSHADVVIANSAFTRRYLLEYNRSLEPRIQIIENAVDVESLGDLELLETDSNRSLRVGLVGHLSEEKGVFDLVELARLVNSERRRSGKRDISFHLYGGLAIDTRSLVEQDDLLLDLSVHFHGYVFDIKSIMANLDVVLNLSKVTESFGRTIAEAMAAARAVVCLRKGALTELVQDRTTGFLVEPECQRKVADLLHVMADDRSIARSVGAAAREIAKSRFTKSVFRHRLSTIYNRIHNFDE